MYVCTFMTKKTEFIMAKYISSKNSRVCMYAGHLAVARTPRMAADSFGEKEKAIVS